MPAGSGPPYSWLKKRGWLVHVEYCRVSRMASNSFSEGSAIWSSSSPREMPPCVSCLFRKAVAYISDNYSVEVHRWAQDDGSGTRRESFTYLGISTPKAFRRQKPCHRKSLFRLNQIVYQSFGRLRVT